MAQQGTPRTGVPPPASSMAERLLVAGTSACIADAMTFPLDTAKVRLQVQGETSGFLLRVSLFYEEAVISSAAPPKYQGMLGTMKTIALEEGPRGLYKGLAPGLQRQMCFSAIKLGMYDTFKDFYHSLIGGPSQNYVNIPTRVMAGMTTGALAVMVAQPTDVVKVRMQAQSQSKGPPRYKTSLQAYSTIFRSEGLRGLWKGFMPNVMRNAIVNVSETVCYDVTKDTLLYYNVLQNGVPLHFSAAAAAGLCATVVASPVDVIKTRYMNAAPGEYRGAVDAAVRMFMQEGPGAFYKGFAPSFCRLGSWNICMWLTYEQVKEMVRRNRES
ncbi:LOW QUALITY PROTEIN: mitochondrial uncoupling protein 2-like [Pollicipes pollicipes]|uniref:LOW QUALITY PROTEIN: mitochondrial uncoupling protein 2-like n=1 Tax=Pollicipes pollicipes TaxID=41117 RepID=UPI0018859D97|nr:LOW QUALITY PROTEIN: mitochondrial uncoupling protein 2-like [Pollicipes pollicipes]